jgi:hypothetical protein
VSRLGVDVESTDLEKDLDEAMNQGDDKVDCGKAGKGKSVPLVQQHQPDVLFRAAITRTTSLRVAGRGT